MERFWQIWQEDNGRMSFMRVGSFLVIVCVMVKYLHTQVATVEEVGMVLGLLGIKAYQKGNEQKCDDCEYHPKNNNGKLKMRTVEDQEEEFETEKH